MKTTTCQTLAKEKKIKGEDCDIKIQTYILLLYLCPLAAFTTAVATGDLASHAREMIGSRRRSTGSGPS